jgi:hypothetical protein
VDINALRVGAENAAGAPAPFGGVTHTGALALTNDDNSLLVGVAIDGQSQVMTAGLVMTFAGRIELAGGFVTGGSFLVSMSDGSSFSASIVPGEGRVRTQAGQGYRVDGLLFNTVFANSVPANQNKFAGVDINALTRGGPIDGSFLNFGFLPDAAGVDRNADLDVSFVGDTAPMPAAAGLGLVGVIGAGCVRRRR